MSNKQRKTLLDRAWPITSTADIVHRGMWHGPIVQMSALERLPPLKRLASQLLTDILGGELIVKDSRAPVFGDGKVEVAERTPEYLYPKLIQLSKVHWLLNTIFRVRIGEVLTPGWEIVPRFKLKCVECGKEFDNPETKECDVCGSKEFDKPDSEQYDDFRRLIGEERTTTSYVGEDRTFRDFLYSTLWYKLALEEFYWEIGHTRVFDTEKKKVVRVPRGIRVLDGSITFPVMDDYGGFTSTEYFCPSCYKEQRTKTGMDVYWDVSKPNEDRVTESNLICPKCGEALKRTAYVQKINGKVVARFAKEEVIHAGGSRVDPDVFSTSNVVSAVKLLYCIDYFDEYNLQIYSHGHANQILGIEGADRQKAEEIMLHIQQQLQSKTRRDTRTGETEFSLEPILVIIGLEQGKRIIPVDISPKLNEMQSIDFYRLYVEKVAGLFGVTNIFMNVADPNQRGGSGRQHVDVQNHVTQQDMNDVAQPFNDQMLPRLGITDWVLSFGKIESRDELRDKQIILTNAQAISLLLDKGFDVAVSEDGRNFTVSPQPVREPQPSSRLESGRLPQNADGAPTRTMPSGTEQGVPIQEPEVDKE